MTTKGGINIDGIPLTCDWADVVDDDDSNSNQIFVSGLYEQIDEMVLREEFEKFGNITDLVLSRNHKSSKRKDLAFITYSTSDEAKHALAFNDNVNAVLGSSVSVSIAFSQQAMQAKKKIKETRKVVTTGQPVLSPMNNVQSATMLTMMNFLNMNKV